MNPNRILSAGADPFPPYQYFDENGNAAGIDFNTVRNAFAKAGYAVELILREWTEIERMMNAGELDVVFQVQKTPEREKIWFFSDLLRKAVTSVISARSDIRLKSLAQASDNGCRIGLIRGYSYGGEVDCLPASTKKEYPSQEELLVAVSRHEIQLAVFDRGVRDFLCHKLSINNIHNVPGLDFIRPLYAAFREEKLRDIFNKGLKEIS